MNLYCTIFDNRTSRLFDVSETVVSLDIITSMFDNPGKCSFEVLKKDELAFFEGATVSVVLDGINMFKGFVFSKQRTANVNLIKVTAYDQLRYLKYKDGLIFKDKTSDQIFAEICDRVVLKYRIVDKSSFICAPKSHSSSSYYEMIKRSLDDTLINSKRWFIIRDNYGVLEHIDVMSMNTGVVLGDYSGITDLNYESSIDNETYNQITLYRDNKESGKRDLFIVNDTINGGRTIKEWGILQLYEQVNEKLNLPQIEQRALGMLSLYNNVKRSLQLDCLGVPQFTSGSIFRCLIKDLGDISLDNYLMVTECTHSIKNGEHFMKLKTEVVRNV